jgi:predicted transposase/invertase (TIGR01784 family)
MRLGYDPKVDYAFKKVFGEANAPVLIDLLHAVVLPARAISGLHFLQPHSEKVSPADKQVIADIRARDQGGRQFHLEMQWEVTRFFPKRALFYWAKFHPEQLLVGEHYATLRPTISVCFANEVVFPQTAEHHLVFRLAEATSGLLLTDDLEIHLLELPKFTKTPEHLSSALDRWLYFLRHGADLDPERLPPSLDVPMIRRAMEVLTVFTQDERERAAYEASLRFQRDQISLIQDAQEKGALFGRVQAYQEMLKQPPTPETELAALPREELAALVEQLRKQLFANGA